MGTQIYSDKYSVNTTRTSHLVLAMTDPWFDQKRDCDSDGWYQHSISNEAFKMADLLMPWQYDEFLKRLPKFYENDWFDNWPEFIHFYDRYSFDFARQFVHDVALTNEDADVYS